MASGRYIPKTGQLAILIALSRSLASIPFPEPQMVFESQTDEFGEDSSSEIENSNGVVFLQCYPSGF